MLLPGSSRDIWGVAPSPVPRETLSGVMWHQHRLQLSPAASASQPSQLLDSKAVELEQDRLDQTAGVELQAPRPVEVSILHLTSELWRHQGAEGLLASLPRPRENQPDKPVGGGRLRGWLSSWTPQAAGESESWETCWKAGLGRRPAVWRSYSGWSPGPRNSMCFTAGLAHPPWVLTGFPAALGALAACLPGSDSVTQGSSSGSCLHQEQLPSPV